MQRRHLADKLCIPAPSSKTEGPCKADARIQGGPGGPDICICGFQPVFGPFYVGPCQQNRRGQACGNVVPVLNRVDGLAGVQKVLNPRPGQQDNGVFCLGG